MTLADSTTTTAIMDRGQDTMPSLPVPSLDDTLNRYLASVRPLLDNQPDAWKHTQQAVEAFRHGDGPRLQTLLEERATNTETSWLLDWWNEYAYFSNRESVCFYVNYCFGFRPDPRPTLDWLTRAASLTSGILEFRDQIRTRELEPDAVRGQPFCMKQYDYLFNACRIPAKPLDYTDVHDLTGNDHLAVVSRGRFYTFDTIHPDGGRRLTTLEILHQLQRIRTLSMDEEQKAPGADPGFGVLSADHRDIWSEKRQRLLAADPNNAAELHRLETATFLLCLDDSKPETDAEFSRACWHGDGRNRFYDKCFQLLAFANGRAGFNGEHSLIDGTTTSRMCRFALDRCEKEELPLGPVATADAAATTLLAEPTKITLSFNDTVLADIHEARTTWEREVEAHQVSVLRYTGYGKGRMKKFGVSPDAYVQMTIQLAYYRMHGLCRSTYESAATRRFRYGRTETARSVSDESLLWVKTMQDTNVSYSAKAEILRKAITTHARNTALAAGGNGIDRHLLGFRMLLADEAKAANTSVTLPDIFTDPTYTYSTHWFLSTSQITDPAVNTYAWGEVVPDGYGFAYMVNEDFVYFNVCSKGMDSATMHDHLENALNDMRTLLEEAQREKDAVSALAERLERMNGETTTKEETLSQQQQQQQSKQQPIISVESSSTVTANKSKSPLLHATSSAQSSQHLHTTICTDQNSHGMAMVDEISLDTFDNKKHLAGNQSGVGDCHVS